MRQNMNQWERRANRASTTLFLAVSFSLGMNQASAQLVRCNPASCVNTAMGKTCEHTWNYPISYGGLSMVSQMTVSGANCSLISNATEIRFVAQKDFTDPASAACSWMGNFNNLGPPAPFECVINMQDGLPVELLHLEVE